LGRPPKAAVKPLRKRFCAWNAYVAAAPLPESAGDHIRTGRHLRQLGQAWQALPQAERKVYEDLAAARLASGAGQEQESGDESGGEAAATEEAARELFRGDWGIGSGQDPLLAELLQTPAYTQGFAGAVERWIAQMEQEVFHDDRCLPYATTEYDDPCYFGECRQLEGYGAAETLRDRFRAKFPRCNDCELFLAFGEGPQGHAVTTRPLPPQIPNKASQKYWMFGGVGGRSACNLNLYGFTGTIGSRRRALLVYRIHRSISKNIPECRCTVSWSLAAPQSLPCLAVWRSYRDRVAH
jgi:hypothetical protein